MRPLFFGGGTPGKGRGPCMRRPRVPEARDQLLQCHAPTTSARRARTNRLRTRVRRAREQAKTAAQLARAVLAGELRQCPWAALKTLYFRGETEAACAAKLARWGKRYGITLEVESHRVFAAGVEHVSYTVRFNRPDVPKGR